MFYLYINSGQTIPNNYSTTNITINVSDGDIVYISGGGCILIILYSVVLINYVIFEMYYNKINQKQKKNLLWFYLRSPDILLQDVSCNIIKGDARRSKREKQK